MILSASCPVCVLCEPHNHARYFVSTPFAFFLQSLRLRNVAPLVAFCLCLAVGTAAQDQAPVTIVPPPLAVPYNPTVYAGFATGPWQIAEGYQYNRISLRGVFAPFDTNGFNTSVTRFFGLERGIDGDAAAGFAPASPGGSASSLFVDAGPHISFRGRSHFEPWVHGLVGLQHFDFGGVSFLATTTSVAWTAGGGLDYRFNSGFAVRVQADYLGSHFNHAFQTNLQIVDAVVWNF
jgi:opacity protein-like surface antigen